MPNQAANDLYGDLGIAVAVVDVNEQVMIRQDAPHPLGKRKHVGPGNESNVGQPVVAGGKAEAAEEQAVKHPPRQGGREDVVDADHGRDSIAHGLSQGVAWSHQSSP